MPKTFLKIACVLLVIIIMITSICSCTPKPEPEYANQIAEGILIALNENDYAGYSEHFNDEMKAAATESVFIQTNDLIKAKIGEYISKEFWKTVQEGMYTSVYYKARFTQEPGEVTVKVVFQETGSEVYVAGLWLDSPKLRQK